MLLSQLSSKGEILLDNCQEIYDMQSIFLELDMKERPSDDLYSAVVVFKDKMKRDTINLLLLCVDASFDEIAEICSISLGAIEAYSKFLFRSREIFTTRMDYINYQTKLELEAESDYELNYALKVKWAISMGKEFVCWRLNLIPTTYNPGELYLAVMKEAFFYHKEKAMGNDSISLAEYLKSSKAVLDAIKTSTSMIGDDKGDVFDIEEELGIIIESRPHPEKTVTEMAKEGMEIITNH